jgi:hypothetical protein
MSNMGHTYRVQEFKRQIALMTGSEFESGENRAWTGIVPEIATSMEQYFRMF